MQYPDMNDHELRMDDEILDAFLASPKPRDDHKPFDDVDDMIFKVDSPRMGVLPMPVPPAAALMDQEMKQPLPLIKRPRPKEPPTEGRYVQKQRPEFLNSVPRFYDLNDDEMVATVWKGLHMAKTQWLLPPTITAMLEFGKRMKMGAKAQHRPPSGSMFFFDSRSGEYFRRDGYDYIKKKGSVISVREDHVKLRVGNSAKIYASYVHSAEFVDEATHISLFHRRSYWLVDSEDKDRGVLIHYLTDHETNSMVVSASTAHPDMCECLLCCFKRENSNANRPGESLETILNRASQAGISLDWTTGDPATAAVAPKISISKKKSSAATAANATALDGNRPFKSLTSGASSTSLVSKKKKIVAQLPRPFLSPQLPPQSLSSQPPVVFPMPPPPPSEQKSFLFITQPNPVTSTRRRRRKDGSLGEGSSRDSDDSEEVIRSAEEIRAAREARRRAMGSASDGENSTPLLYPVRQARSSSQTHMPTMFEISDHATSSVMPLIEASANEHDDSDTQSLFDDVDQMILSPFHSAASSMAEIDHVHDTHMEPFNILTPIQSRRASLISLAGSGEAPLASAFSQVSTIAKMLDIRPSILLDLPRITVVPETITTITVPHTPIEIFGESLVVLDCCPEQLQPHGKVLVVLGSSTTLIDLFSKEGWFQNIFPLISVWFDEYRVPNLQSVAPGIIRFICPAPFRDTKTSFTIKYMDRFLAFKIDPPAFEERVSVGSMMDGGKRPRPSFDHSASSLMSSSSKIARRSMASHLSSDLTPFPESTEDEVFLHDEDLEGEELDKHAADMVERVVRFMTSSSSVGVDSVVLAEGLNEISGDHGFNFLHTTVFCGANLKVVQMLLAHGADPNVRTGSGGNTALHLVSETCNTHIARILIQAGAQVDALNDDGYTPAELILSREENETDEEMLKLLGYPSIHAPLLAAISSAARSLIVSDETTPHSSPMRATVSSPRRSFVSNSPGGVTTTTTTQFPRSSSVDLNLSGSSQQGSSSASGVATHMTLLREALSSLSLKEQYALTMAVNSENSERKQTRSNSVASLNEGYASGGLLPVPPVTFGNTGETNAAAGQQQQFDANEIAEDDLSRVISENQPKLFAELGKLQDFDASTLDMEASKIQCNVRAWILRKKFKEMKEATTKVQAVAKGHLARRHFRELREKASATLVIQRSMRAHIEAKKRAVAESAASPSNVGGEPEILSPPAVGTPIDFGGIWEPVLMPASSSPLRPPHRDENMNE